MPSPFTKILAKCHQATASDLPFYDIFAPQKITFSKISDDVIGCDLWFGSPPNQKSWLRLWSGLHEIFCAIQKREFLTCMLCSKLPSKLEFHRKFQVNSLLSFRVKHFSAASTELLATMSNSLLLEAKVFSDAPKNVHLLSTSRYLICLKYNSNFVCNLAENCRLQLCAFLTSHSQKKNVFVYVFVTNFELLQLKKFFF